MLERGFYSFKDFDDFNKEIDRINKMANNIMRTFFFDKPFSLVSIKQEKEKHNFSTRHWQEVVKDDKAILVYDIHGISPDDIIVKKVVEDGIAYITIEGKTKNEELNCEMEVRARWAIPYKQFKKPTKKIENGLLYVYIEKDKNENDEEII